MSFRAIHNQVLFGFAVYISDMSLESEEDSANVDASEQLNKNLDK